MLQQIKSYHLKIKRGVALVMLKSSSITMFIINILLLLDAITKIYHFDVTKLYYTDVYGYKLHARGNNIIK